MAKMNNLLIHVENYSLVRICEGLAADSGELGIVWGGLALVGVGGLGGG